MYIHDLRQQDTHTLGGAILNAINEAKWTASNMQSNDSPRWKDRFVYASGNVTLSVWMYMDNGGVSLNDLSVSVDNKNVTEYIPPDQQLAIFSKITTLRQEWLLANKKISNKQLVDSLKFDK